MAKSKKKWSQDVTDHSDAMDLKEGVFKSDDPKKIARSVKHSAEESDHRKSSPFRAAMSMLTFLHQPRRRPADKKAARHP
ncbi:Protein of unknown function (DUF3175) [Rhizobium leguminosarum bv. trifolii WSM2012]|nr:Protein of unknown function (DUF3175) [Rhizobium leguminosarum bv. trifolii WSM2012]